MKEKSRIATNCIFFCQRNLFALLKNLSFLSVLGIYLYKSLGVRLLKILGKSWECLFELKNATSSNVSSAKSNTLEECSQGSIKRYIPSWLFLIS